MDSITINQLIKNSIELNKLSIKNVAQAAGMSEKSLRKVLNSKDISVSNLHNICKTLGTNVSIEFSNNNGEKQIYPLIAICDEKP